MSDLKKVLVTGASGYIGRALASTLRQQGVQVVATGRRQDEKGPWDEYYRADLTEEAPPAAAFKDVDMVFHLAGMAHQPSLQHEETYRKVNVDGTRRILDAMHLYDVGGIVYFSSVAVFEIIDANGVTKPVTSRKPTAYASSKYEAEQMVLSDEGIQQCCVLRPALVYGPGCPGNLERMVIAIRRGLFPPVPQIRNCKSMVHVQDLVDAAILVAGNKETNRNAYIVTDQVDYSTGQLYVWIRRALGKTSLKIGVPLGVLVVLARLGDILGHLSGRILAFNSSALEKLTGDTCFSSEEISKAVGYRPRFNLKDNIDEIVQYLGKP